MNFTFQDSLAWLNDTAPQGKSVYGLGRIKHLLDLLGHPENNYKLITIVGTNGKGSTLAFMDSILRAHGLKVGCHIKPHLECVTERIRLHGADISCDGFASTAFEVKTAVDHGWSRDDRPTYFELIFATALVAMKHALVDIALLETGLGGRLDAVNSVDADLVVLTSVDYDHTELLGNTLSEITSEKIAIVRPGSVLVCQQNSDEVLGVVRHYAVNNNVELIFPLTLDTSVEKAPGLEGPWQELNASLAAEAVRTFAGKVCPEIFPNGFDEDKSFHGLRTVRIPGRWERFQSANGGTGWIIDGAHNPSGLAQVLDYYKGETHGHGTIIFGMKKGKDFEKVLPMLLGSCDNLVFVGIPGLDCFDPVDMLSIAERLVQDFEQFSQVKVYNADSIEEALVEVPCVAQNIQQVLVTGSLYLAGAARSIIMRQS